MVDKKIHPAHVYIASLSEGSRRTMWHALNVVADIASRRQLTAETYPWQNMKFADSAAVRAELTRRYAPKTSRKIIAALKGAVRMAWRLGLMTREECERTLDIATVRGSRIPPGRGLTRGEVLALMDECYSDKTDAGRRDAAAIALLYGAGLRRRELASLALASVDLNKKAVKVLGKGGKERAVPIQQGTVNAIVSWLEVRGRRGGTLLLAVSKGGKVRQVGITGHGIYRMLERRAKAARVPVFSPHDLRRSYISDLLDAGADLAIVQRLAGHADINTTAIYDRRGEQANVTAADLLLVPGPPPVE